jgi:CopG antitoxin of type II toxin-antitoxin system
LQNEANRFLCPVRATVGVEFIDENGGGSASASDSAKKRVRNGYAMNKKLKSIPRFRSEADERRFWEENDSADYIDWTKARRVRFPNLKPSTTAIALRLPVTLLERIKVATNKGMFPINPCSKPGLLKRRERDDQ